MGRNGKSCDESWLMDKKYLKKKTCPNGRSVALASIFFLGKSRKFDSHSKIVFI
jgi:hypothetical protein